jgi:hypothetical protein
MATEEVMIDYDMQTPEKKKVKKVASMKNNAMYEAPNPFRNKAELMEYRKKIEKLYRPGYGEMGRKERPSSEMIEMLEKKSITPKSKSKPKTSVMKKLGSAAGKVIDKLDDKSIKETMLKQNALMPLSSKPMERELPEEKFTIRKAHDYDGRMKEAAPFESVMGSKETPMDEKKFKLESLKKPAIKKD